mgnify:CR=1 FL=1
MRLKAFLVVTLGLGCLTVPALAQKSKKGAAQPDGTIAKPMTDKERKRKEDQLKKELETSLSLLDNVVPIHKDVA